MNLLIRLIVASGIFAISRLSESTQAEDAVRTGETAQAESGTKAGNKANSMGANAAISVSQWEVTLHTGQKYRFNKRAEAVEYSNEINAHQGWSATIRELKDTNTEKPEHERESPNDSGTSTRSEDDATTWEVVLHTGKAYRFNKRTEAVEYMNEINDHPGWSATIWELNDTNAAKPQQGRERPNDSGTSTRSEDDGTRWEVVLHTGKAYRFNNRAEAVEYLNEINAHPRWSATIRELGPPNAGATQKTEDSQRPDAPQSSERPQKTQAPQKTTELPLKTGAPQRTEIPPKTEVVPLRAEPRQEQLEPPVAAAKTVDVTGTWEDSLSYLKGSYTYKFEGQPPNLTVRAKGKYSNSTYQARLRGNRITMQRGENKYEGIIGDRKIEWLVNDREKIVWTRVP